MIHKWSRILKRPMALLLAVVMVLLAVPPQALQTSADDGNLISNSRFDTDLSGWKTMAVDDCTGTLTWSDGAALLTTADAFGMENEVLLAVEPGGRYHLSYIATLSEGAALSVCVYYYTADGTSADMPYSMLDCGQQGKTQQQESETTFTVPADARQVSVSFILNSQDGEEVTAQLDQVGLYREEETVSFLNASNMPVNLTAYDAAQQALLKAMRNTTSFPAFALDVQFDDGEELPWSLWSGAAVADGIMTQSADANGYAQGGQKYAVEAGQTYVISAKIKATGRAQAVYWLYEYNAQGGKIQNKHATAFYSGGTNDWVDFIYEYTPAANVASVQFHVQTNEGQNKGGSIQWDYVTVKLKNTTPEPETTAPTVPETTAPETTAPQPTVPAQDPAFALDVQFNDGEELPWSLWSGATVAGGILTQSADANGYAEGSTKYTVESGKTYVLSAKIKATGRSQAVYWLYEYNAQGGKIQNKPLTAFYNNGTSDWVDFIAEYTPAAGVAMVQFHLQTNEGQNRGGSIQWDYVKVYEKGQEQETTAPETTVPETTVPETTEPETTAPAATEPTDFALDVQFNDGQELPWNLWSGSSVSGGVLTQSADANGYAEGFTKYTVESGETYVISAKIKATGRSQAVYWIHEYNAQGAAIKTKPLTAFYNNGTNNWVDFIAEYTPAADVATVLFHLQTNEGQGRGGSIQWDYVTVVRKSDIPEQDTTVPTEPNPGETTAPQPTEPVLCPDFDLNIKFDDGEELPWNLWSAATVAGGVLTQSADANGYAEGNQVFKVESDKKYTLSSKINAQGRAQAIYWLVEFDANGNELGRKHPVKFFENGSDGWVDFVAEYTPSTGAAAVLFHLQTNEGQGKGGSVQWDYITVEGKTVVPTPPDTCVPPNGNFEQGDNKAWMFLNKGTGTYSFEDMDGNKVLKTQLTGEGQVYSYSQQVKVKPSYIYTISYKVKVTPDSTENLKPYGAITVIQEFSGGKATGKEISSSARNKTDGWETVTYEYITSAAAEAIRLDLMFANNPGVVLWDDFSITEKAPYEPVKLDASYDHGGTDDTANPENVIPNGTFDKGVIQGWSAKEGIAAYQTKNENGGVVRFDVKPGSYLQSNAFPLQGLSEYELTYYVKVEDAKDLRFLSYFTGTGQKWHDFLSYTVSADTDGQWQQVKLRFATSAVEEGAQGYIGFKAVHPQTCGWQKTNDDADCDCQASGTVYLDDISLIRVGDVPDVGDGLAEENSVVYNGSFDRYYSDPKTVDGWSLNPVNPNHDTYIQNKVVHGDSGNAIAINATGHSYIWVNDFSVEPGNIYILSYWVKVDAAEELKFAPYMNDHNYKGGWWLDDAAQPIYDVTDGWVKISSAVSIPESVGNNERNPQKNIQLGFQVYKGAGVIYLDDVSMVKTDVDAQNSNMDFELSSEILYNWSSSSSAKGKIETSASVRPGSSGKVSALVSNVASSGSTNFISRMLDVEPSTTYEFSFWVRTEGSYDAMCTPHFRQVAADGVSKATSLTWDGNNMVTTWSEMISPYWTYQTQGEVNWRQVNMSVTTGKGCEYLQIRFVVSGANTKVYLDDISLRKTAQDINLDFERTSSVTGAPMNWYLSTARSYNVLTESDNTVYHSGNQSYHIYKDSILERISVDSSAFIPVSSDNTYEFSFWMSSKNCSPTTTIRMNMQLYRADGTRIYQNDGNYQTMQGIVASLHNGPERSGWTKVVTRAKPVNEAAYATISFTISRGTAEVWIDDIFMNVVEDGTDCVVYYDDFHALDQDGNTGDWTMETLSGEASFQTGNGGKLEITSGESYIHNEMKQIATDYTYTIRGKYTGDIGGIAEMRFYDYKKTELTDSRTSVPLLADGEEFELSFVAPSNSFASLYIGSDQAGTIELENVTVYMVAKSSKSADWDGRWVWYLENPTKEAVEQYRYFRYTFTLNEEAEYAPFQLTVDDKYAFYLNGELIDENWDAGGDSWADVASYDLTDKVKKGENIIALKCYNLVSEAAILFDGKFTLKDQSTAIVASSNQVVSTKTVNEDNLDWTKLEFDDSDWLGCKEYGQPPCSPWGAVFYNNTLYIKNVAEVVSTSVPDAVTAGRDLKFTMTMKLDSPIEANFTPTVTVYKRNSIKAVTSVPLTFENYEKPLNWPVGEEFEISCKITVPDYMDSGKYSLQMDENLLLLTGKDVYDNRFVDFKVNATNSARDNVVSSIEVYNGAPTLLIDGEPVASHLYLRPDLDSYLQTDAETRIYKSGLELFITYGGGLYKGGCKPIWLEDGTIDYDVFDKVIYDTLAASNDALVMVNIGMFAPHWWIEQNPGHELLVDNGSQYIAIDNEVSLASEKFREEAGEVLRLLIRHMKEQSYYNRVFGLKISGGQSYEWMVRGTGADKGPDYSEVSREGFKKYLKRIYGTNEALQEAWGDKNVTFETAEAPGWRERGSTTNVYAGSVNSGKVSRNIVDWNLWINEASADSFLYYCQIAKEETDYKLIVGGYNGYLWTSNSYDSQGMAHTAAERVLDSEYVDWISSPVAYNERVFGESNTYMALLDSVQEHGKIYIAEQDNRTCLSNAYAGAPWDADWDFSIGQTRTVADTIYQQKRDFANALVNGAGLWQFDMYGGWLDDDQIYQYLRDAKAEYDFSVYMDRDMRNEVAIFVGDTTYAYLRAGQPNMPYTLLDPMLMQQRKHLAAMGAGYDTYTMSSLLDGKVEPHKLNIILSPFEIDEEMNQAIDKYLKCNGQYVVWVYLPGITDGYTMDTDFMKRTTGFDIGVVEEKSGLQVKLAKTNNVLTQGIEGLVYGNSTPNSVSPLTYIKDTTDVAVLGYNMDGAQRPGLGIKDMGDWTSIYSSAPCLDVDLLRNMLKLAECHVYSDNNEDVIYSSNCYVALHSAAAGEKTITLKDNYAVYDVFEEKFISMDTNTITYYHEENDTHIFRLTTPNTYAVTARLKAGRGELSAPGLTELSPGESYHLAVTPAEGYEVSSVLVNGKETELADGVLHIGDVSENYVVEVKFNKLPEMVEVIEYVQELVILPWWAAILCLAALSAAVWGISKGVKALRRKLEEGGY